MAQGQLPRIAVEKRERVGSRYAARLRKEGKLPAVVYGHGVAPEHVVVDKRKFIDILRENAHLIEADSNGAVEPCLVKEIQWDHLGREIIHVDLTRVDLTEEVEVEVDLEFIGEPKALETPGAVLEHPQTQIRIRCTAGNIPQNIQVDISSLEIDQMITVADLKLPAGVTAEEDEETMIARISVIEEVSEEQPAAEAGGAEPEVIGRGKKDEEGAAAE